MSLRHAVLGLLSIEPSTGYELTRRFDSSLANAWHASHSQLYPLLSRMEREGLIEVASEGARRSRTWAVTDAGRSELREWLVATEPDRGQRNETGLRWFMQELLDPADRRAVLERELAYMRVTHAQLQALWDRKLAAEGDRPRGFHAAADLGLRMQQVMIPWLEEQLAALDADED
jgi:DNA-binding PadR family transcriptional regulator